MLADVFFISIYIFALSHLIFADKLFKMFSRPDHERLASQIVKLRLEMMEHPIAERQEYLKEVARLEAQYAFLTGVTTIKRPLKSWTEETRPKAEVVPLRRLK